MSFVLTHVDAHPDNARLCSDLTQLRSTDDPSDKTNPLPLKCHVSMALRRDNTASQLFKHAGVIELPYLRVTTKGTLTRGSHRGGNPIRVWQRPINKQITELTTDANAWACFLTPPPPPHPPSLSFFVWFAYVSPFSSRRIKTHA